MWKRTHRSRQGQPRLPVLEVLEERRLLAGGLLGGVTHLLQKPTASLTQAAVTTVPAVDVSLTPAAGTATPEATATQATADNPAVGSGGLLAALLPVVTTVTTAPNPSVLDSAVSAPTTQPSETQPPLSLAVGVDLGAVLSVPTLAASVLAPASTNPAPATPSGQGSSLGGLLGTVVSLLPDLGVTVTVGTQTGSDSGGGSSTGTSADGGLSVSLGGTATGGTAGGVQLGLNVGSLLDAVVGDLLGGSGSTGGGGATGGGSGGTTDPGGGSSTGTSGPSGGTTTSPPSDGSGTQGQDGQTPPPDAGPGGNGGTTSGSSQTGTGVSVGGTVESNDPPAGVPDTPQTPDNGGNGQTPPAESNGASGQGQTAPAQTETPAGDTAEDPQTESAEAAASTEAAAGPVAETGTVPPTGPETVAPPAANAGAARQGTADDARNEVIIPDDNVPDNGPAAAGAAANPGPAPLQPGWDGANLPAVAEALFAAAAGSDLVESVAGALPEGVGPENAAAPADVSPGALPLEALPQGMVPLSQGEGPVSGFLPFDARTLEAGLSRFLEQLQVSGWSLARVPPSLWLLAGATLAAAGEVLRRRWRRGRTDLDAAEEMRETLRWFPDLGPTEEDA